MESFKKTDLEILVSTMNRDNFDFLVSMFPFDHFSNFSILVINQTSPEHILVSEYESVRVVNSFEKGLSKSRNLALQNAVGKIALIADDDVVFLNDFDQKILDAHHINPEVSLICFRTINSEGNLVRYYPNGNKVLKSNELIWVLSIEITFKIDKIRENNITFNEHFGLGAQFEDAESLYFLRNAHHKSLKILSSSEPIVIHHQLSSSDEVTSDRWLYAKSAGNYKLHQNFAYFLVFKNVFFLWRKKYILTAQIFPKIKIAFNGIRDYKKLILDKKEIRSN